VRRFWILLCTEFKAWRRDPITVLGGFIPAVVLLVTFGILFGGRLALRVAVLNRDTGTQGSILARTIREELSPFGTPYYEVVDLPEDSAWQAYQAHRIDGVWVIPADFSQRLALGQMPTVEMHFGNYIDDRAKNHRIYAAEVIWAFYHQIDQPPPPLALAEEYPLPQMVAWFPIIAVGVVLLSTTLGGMFNIFMLTHKEQIAKVTLEFGLAPRSLAWVFLPKLLLALIMGLVTGVVFLAILYLWIGAWPGRYLGAVCLLSGLVAVFWISWALLLGLRVRNYMAGAIASILSAVTLFFIGGGLSIVRGYEDRVLRVAWLFPNTYAVDPLRDLVLFNSWPSDWTATLLRLIGFAVAALAVGLTLAARQLRRLS
jgi:hypothetical protein